MADKKVMVKVLFKCSDYKYNEGMKNVKISDKNDVQYCQFSELKITEGHRLMTGQILNLTDQVKLNWYGS